MDGYDVDPENVKLASNTVSRAAGQINYANGHFTEWASLERAVGGSGGAGDAGPIVSVQDKMAELVRQYQSAVGSAAEFIAGSKHKLDQIAQAMRDGADGYEELEHGNRNRFANPKQPD